ncbi:MAG: HemK/PrmC family methyltransferase [Minisyncoccia bacterium]|jgi:release factor glutamine methyltransferase
MNQDERWLLKEKYNGIKTPEYEKDKKRLARGEPLGYVIGWQPFLGLKIFLDSKPFIPRPETEWWTEQAIAVILAASASDDERHEQIFSRKLCAPQNHGDGLRFLDLCAGSGAIGCAALARLPNAQVYFGEINHTHEATILKNIRKNNLNESRTIIRIGNLFKPFGNLKFNIIIANPPYIPKDRALPRSVADYEPSIALYAGADGLDCIRRIAKELPHHLKKNGTAWIECDGEHAEIARALFQNKDFNAEIKTDQYGVPRTIVVSFP